MPIALPTMISLAVAHLALCAASSQAGDHGRDLPWSGGDLATVTASDPTPVAVPLAEYHAEDLVGFQVLVEPEVLKSGLPWRRVRAAILADLERIVEVVPPSALERLRTTPIAVTRHTVPRREWEGSSAACLHVSPAWLEAHGYDAARAGVVEILHMDRFLLWRAEQPMMLLHELAHAYHLGMEGGYAEPNILRAYRSAMDAGLYEAVPYILAAPHERRRAYAATNAQEYFAELTEAYFGRNDYYPFTREQLRAHDPQGLAAVERAWGFGEDPTR